MKRLRLQLQLAVIQHLFLWVILWNIQTSSAQLASTTRVAGTTPTAAKNAQAPPSYFYIDANGNYKYTYDTGTGFQGEQSASAANEVIGHYTYYEKGVPYTVNYKSGVQGYRPELIPVSSGPHVAAQFMRFGNGGFSNIITAAPATQTVATTSRALEMPTTTIVIPLLNARTPQELTTTQTSLTSHRFVQDAMKMMRTNPVQLSFASQQGFLQQRQQQQQQQITQQQQQQITQQQQQQQQQQQIAQQQILQQPITQTQQPIQQRLPQQQQQQQQQQLQQQIQSSIQQLHLQLPTLQQQQQTQHSQQKITSQNVSPITLQNMQQVPQNLQQQQQEQQQPYTFSYFADQSAHMQTSDKNGNVLGKYAYYDQNGFHDLAYQAGAETGFVVIGGNLSKPAVAAVQQPLAVVNVAHTQPHGSYNYSILPRLQAPIAASVTTMRQK